MAAKPKPRRKRSQPVMVVDEDGLQRLALSPTAIKWAVGLVSGVFALLIGWFAIWDRIEAHWRLESVQAAKDKAIEAEIKAAKDKAEADNKELARRAEVGRAWLFWSVLDGKAIQTSQWAELCKFLKRPGDVCTKHEIDAAQYRQEAAEAKRAATQAGKSQ